MLVRQGAHVDRIGKVAELQPDGSPLRVGSRGQHDGLSFELLGRIQLSYGDGYWNEWFLLLSNGSSGWLGEAMGEYFINVSAKVDVEWPPAEQFSPGDLISLAGEPFVVTDRVTSQLVTFEGELPFVVDGGQPFVSIDLRSASGRAATVDYSESPPLLFVGEYRPFAAFGFQGLRAVGEGDDEQASTTVAAAGVSSFNCPSCAAPHTVSGGVRSKVLVCQYCGSAVDITNPKLEIMWKEDAARHRLSQGVTLAIGSVGRLGDEEFTVIGFLRKSVTYDGVHYPWLEYLLYNRLSGYRWLVEGDGHFTLMEPAAKLPVQGGRPAGWPDERALTYEGRIYRHFQTSHPRIEAVAGEFYWRVRSGEKTSNFDYVCPPYLLSMEASETGFAWSIGRYLEHDEVRALFSLQGGLPAKVGVAACQPNPHDQTSRSHWKVFWVALVLGLVVMMSPLLPNTAVWSSGPQTLQTFRNFVPAESAPFTVNGAGNIAFTFQGSLSDRWLFFDTSLVDANSQQQVAKVGATIDNYSGSTALGTKTVRISGVAPGEYKLRWTVKSGSTTPNEDPVDNKVVSQSITYRIALTRGVPVWTWYFLMILLLLPIPLFESARRSSFETKRWYNSDHS